MRSYGQFSVFPRIDQMPIWRDRDQAEPIATASRNQKLVVVRREHDLYRIRVMGIGYGYVRPEDVISEHEANAQSSAQQPSKESGYGSGGASREPYPNGAFPGDAHTGFAPVGFIEAVRVHDRLHDPHRDLLRDRCAA
jgi:hypothetical protein